MAPSGAIAIGAPKAQPLPDWLANSSKAATIGAGESRDAFGEIAQVAIDAAGFVYVLDSEFNDVRVFDPTGRALKQLGYQHSPETPFRSPISIAVKSNNEGATLFVADRGRRVHAYNRRADSLAFASTISLTEAATDLCVSGERLIVQAGGYKEPEIVRAYSLDGGEISTFGRLYRTDNTLLRYTFARARLACLGHLRTESWCR